MNRAARTAIVRRRPSLPAAALVAAGLVGE